MLMITLDGNLFTYVMVYIFQLPVHTKEYAKMLLFQTLLRTGWFLEYFECNVASTSILQEMVTSLEQHQWNKRTWPLKLFVWDDQWGFLVQVECGLDLVVQDLRSQRGGQKQRIRYAEERSVCYTFLDYQNRSCKWTTIGVYMCVSKRKCLACFWRHTSNGILCVFSRLRSSYAGYIKYMQCYVDFLKNTRKRM